MSMRCVGMLVALTCVSAVPGQAHAANTDERCFNETGYCIAGRIRAYWEQNGGLPIFGFPTGPQQAEQVEGKTLQAQPFERHRLELHPENAAPYDVLLGRLGADLLAQTGVFAPESAPREGCQFFAQTSFNVCGRFLEAWRADGLEFDGSAGKSYAESLALFGLPLGSERSFQAPDGTPYTMQWFERARFEYHPENQPPYDVLFGLLGNEASGTRPLPTVASGDIVFVSDRAGNNEIYAMNSDGSDQRRLTNDPRDDTSPKWSPDGSKIAFLRDINATGTPSGGRDVFVMHADGSDLVTPAVDVNVFGDIQQFAWSPDSSKLVLSRKNSATTSDLVVIMLDESLPGRVIPGSANNTNPAWSPDGSTIAFVSDRDGADKLYVVDADGNNARKIADVMPWGEPVWSPTSRIVFFAANGEQPGVYSATSDGSGVTTLIAQSDYVSRVAIVRDGTQIAYQISSRNSQNTPVGGTLWVADSDGNNAVARVGTAVTPGTAASDPTWAPTGARFAWVQFCFQSRPSDRCSVDTNIFVTNALGTNQRQLTQNSGRNFQPNWR